MKLLGYGIGLACRIYDGVVVLRERGRQAQQRRKVDRAISQWAKDNPVPRFTDGAWSDPLGVPMIFPEPKVSRYYPRSRYSKDNPDPLLDVMSEEEWNEIERRARGES